MALRMMLISATSMIVKSRKKRAKVIITDEASILEIAACTGRRFCIVQGWRPTSATTQPASLAIQAQGVRTRLAHRSHLVWASFSLRR